MHELQLNLIPSINMNEVRTLKFRGRGLKGERVETESSSIAVTACSGRSRGYEVFADSAEWVSLGLER